MPSAADGSTARPFIGVRTTPALIVLMTWTERESRHLTALAEALGPDQPLFGILPPTTEPLPTCVDEWVDHFAARLAELPIEAPYFLVGWSFGGVIAVELARRLRRSGAPVAYVGMIDSWSPAPHTHAGRGNRGGAAGDLRVVPEVRADRLRRPGLDLLVLGKHRPVERRPQPRLGPVAPGWVRTGDPPRWSFHAVRSRQHRPIGGRPSRQPTTGPRTGIVGPGSRTRTLGCSAA
jgi:pimeloyl-ACP methyl ester carboxylesterase